MINESKCNNWSDKEILCSQMQPNPAALKNSKCKAIHVPVRIWHGVLHRQKPCVSTSVRTRIRPISMELNFHWNPIGGGLVAPVTNARTSCNSRLNFCSSPQSFRAFLFRLRRKILPIGRLHLRWVLPFSLGPRLMILRQLS